MVVRRGIIEHYRNSKGSGRLWKLIFLDHQGGRIQATVFNDDIDELEQSLRLQKTYFVCNGIVNSINPNFLSAHNKIEQTLNQQTRIENVSAATPVDSLFRDFVPFDQLDGHAEKNEIIDIIGIVVDVQPTITSENTTTGKAYTRRQITLVDSTASYIQVTLWGDLAVNEGNTLEQQESKILIVVASNVKASKFAERPTISTTATSIIQINPHIHGAVTLTEWFKSSSENLKKIHVKQPRNLKKESAAMLKIKDIIEDSLDEYQNSYCSFAGRVLRIDNLGQPYYLACDKCNKEIVERKEGAQCQKCNKTTANYSARYLLKATLGDGDHQVQATFFEAAEQIIGLSVTDFIGLQKDDNRNSKTHSIETMAYERSYIFLTKIARTNEKERREGKIVVDQVNVIEDIDGTTEDVHALKPLKKIKIEKD